MPRVVWDDTDNRLYHVGVDRGMLYTVAEDVIPVAVPWNGLASVTEAPEGGDPTPYYLDGQKLLNLSAGEDYAGTIEAYATPLEFAPCAGRTRLSTGLFASDQPHKEFGYSYRTLIGNDSAGIAFAYKIHIVYNALAKVADFAHATITTSASAKTSSWDVTTYPVVIPGARPTSHFIFDTRSVDPFIISRIEDILYGNDSNDPRMPTVDELLQYLIIPPDTMWWDLTGLTDFPGGASVGDMGVDFATDDIYANFAENTSAYWWDLTDGADFPPEAVIGDWGYDTDTGQVYEYTA